MHRLCATLPHRGRALRAGYLISTATKGAGRFTTARSLSFQKKGEPMTDDELTKLVAHLPIIHSEARKLCDEVERLRRERDEAARNREAYQRMAT